MHAAARDGGDVDDGALRGGKFVHQPAARARWWRRDSPRTPGARPPCCVFSVSRRAAALALWRDAPALLTSACSLPSVSRSRISRHGAQVSSRIGEIDLDVILRPRSPGAILRESVARTGDHPPAGAGEALHRGMPDAPAGAGEDQGAAFFGGFGLRSWPKCSRAFRTSPTAGAFPRLPGPGGS